MTEHNPPAFPTATLAQKTEGGMTLLDHFAGLAMPAIAAEIYSWSRELTGGTVAELTAKMSYEMANAMLKEREKWIK